MRNEDLMGDWKLAWVNEKGAKRPGPEKYLGVLRYGDNGKMSAAVLKLTGEGLPLLGGAPGAPPGAPPLVFQTGFYFAYAGDYTCQSAPSDPNRGTVIHTIHAATCAIPGEVKREAELTRDGLLILEITEGVEQTNYWAWRRVAAGQPCTKPGPARRRSRTTNTP